jgi:hypothetical protein
MEIFNKEVSIIDIISLRRKAFPRISEEPWFSEYLTARITASFEADKGIFQREQFFEGFGESVDFDKFLGKVMAQVYLSKISAIRRGTELCGSNSTNLMPNAIVFENFIFILRTKFLKLNLIDYYRALNATRFLGRSFMSGITTC